MKLSALLGLWEGAVELALRVRLALAKSVAALPDCPHVQRQLWLHIGDCRSHLFELNLFLL